MTRPRPAPALTGPTFAAALLLGWLWLAMLLVAAAYQPDPPHTLADCTTDIDCCQKANDCLTNPHIFEDR